MEARILAFADVIEAIASHRPYRPSQSIGMALEEILHNKGVLYDVNAYLRVLMKSSLRSNNQIRHSAAMPPWFLARA